jgi:hypothetical protein
MKVFGQSPSALEPSFGSQVVLTVALLLAAVATIDAALGRHWDLVALEGVVVVLLAMVLAGSRWGRPAVPVRSDLVRWLRRRAVETGEPVGAIADRAVATYRREVADPPVEARAP